ncbi:MAG TPA: FGGY-family carbohydrate kinase [Desulfomonilia bacterium]
MYVISYDIGTTACKTCIYRIADKIEMVDSSLAEYPLYLMPDGGAEQVADDWWKAVCSGTKEVLACTKIAPGDISGISFCCQMQGSVMVDRAGNALRNPMGYMDARAKKQMEETVGGGLIKISGVNAFTLLNWLRLTGGAAATAKDPIWKYLWVRDNEPEIFASTHKWLDVKDYLLMRCTGNFAMTRDSANVTFLYDTRPGKLSWHEGLCKRIGVNMDHLPPVVDSTDKVGGITEKAALEMGLKAGTPVFGGGGDVSLIALGAGCLATNDTHVYVGTSGWVSSCVDKRMVDVGAFVASILGAIPGKYNYTAEQETSGLCLKWVKDHLALDEIGIYLEKQHVCEKESEYESLYDFLNKVISETEPGSGGVIFTPWFHGNRAPREDPHARAMFFNLGLETGKRMMVRSVLEGDAMHKRWSLEAVEKRVPKQDVIRFAGGGAKSEVWCQIMADVTGKVVETIEEPQNAGALGAAVVTAVGLNIFKSFDEAKSMIPVKSVYSPQDRYRAVYDRNFKVFKGLYANNRKAFHLLNG